MAKNDIKIEFVKDYAILKKGYKQFYSRDLANMLIKKGVAKVYEAKKVSRKKSK